MSTEYYLCKKDRPWHQERIGFTAGGWVNQVNTFQEAPTWPEMRRLLTKLCTGFFPKYQIRDEHGRVYTPSEFFRKMEEPGRCMLGVTWGTMSQHVLKTNYAVYDYSLGLLRRDADRMNSLGFGFGVIQNVPSLLWQEEYMGCKLLEALK